jgi:iron-sulfur cluster repair protein YtfE (RIC family)
MGTIIEFMSADQQACDDKFVLAEQAAYANNRQETDSTFAALSENMTLHFRREEELLFPALLAASGPVGTVQVMKMEHVQMSSLLEKMAALVADNDVKSYRGLAETLLILMQQHILLQLEKQTS